MVLLNRCPHCGGIATLWSVDCCNTVYAVCTTCGTRTKDCHTTEDAADIWNKRFVQLVNVEQTITCFEGRRQQKIGSFMEGHRLVPAQKNIRKSTG